MLDAGHGRSDNVRAFFIPGRIEVLGKHTDYAGGRSIVAATERGICIVAAPRQDADVHVTDALSHERAEFPLSADIRPPRESWRNYSMTVARRIAKNFPGARIGADLAFASDLPQAAGMSSSSALVIATFFALAAVNDLTNNTQYTANIASREDLAAYLSAVENGQGFSNLSGDRGVGTQGGSEDHVAMLCCRRGAVSVYSYCPVRLERHIPLPEGHVFAVAFSGISARKTGDAREPYNRASQLAAAVAEAWRQETGGKEERIADALASAGDAADRMRAALQSTRREGYTPQELLDRFEHFVIESEQIVPEAADALAAGNIQAFGSLVDKSQAETERLLGNQIPETILLARCARDMGASAASAFGAGFGGSVWALVRVAEADSFLQAWAARYRDAFPGTAPAASFFETAAGPSAFEYQGAGDL